MKPPQLFITVLCLLLFAALGLAQMASAQSGREMYQQMDKDNTKMQWRAFRNDESSNSTMLGYMWHADLREGFGISEEQYRKIMNAVEQGFVRDMSGAMYIEPPENQRIRDAINELERERGNPFAEDASEEAKKRFLELNLQINTATHKFQEERASNALNEHLTPDQWQKIREFQISTMFEKIFINPHMFEVFDLCDEQKELLDEIKREMEPKFETLVDRFHALHWKQMLGIYEDEHIEKLSAASDHEERQKLLEEIQSKIRAELQPEKNAVMESCRKLVNELTIRMFDVLTDEQWMRLQELINNPPDYAKAWLKKRKELAGESEEHEASEEDAKPGVWIPGPGAWKPGDSVIPEQYRQERNTRSRFPRGEN